jgi:hypothetical protein
MGPIHFVVPCAAKHRSKGGALGEKWAIRMPTRGDAAIGVTSTAESSGAVCSSDVSELASLAFEDPVASPFEQAQSDPAATSAVQATASLMSPSGSGRGTVS